MAELCWCGHGDEVHGKQREVAVCFKCSLVTDKVLDHRHLFRPIESLPVQSSPHTRWKRGT